MFKKLLINGSFFVFIICLQVTQLYAGSNQVLNKHSQNNFKIAIFREKGFPGIAVPDLLTPEWLYNTLSGEFSVSYLDAQKLSDTKYLDPGKVDLLILPYGEAFPLTAFPAIKEYLYSGGGIFNIAGKPFGQPMQSVNNGWKKVINIDPYEEFMAKLGIKYYELPQQKMIGLSVTTSLNVSPIIPSHGNVFPYRIPVRDFYHFEFFKTYNCEKSITFVKSWLNPYTGPNKKIPKKWAFIGNTDENNPLNPKNQKAGLILMNIIRQISFPLVLSELSTNMPVYRQGEAVKIRVKLTNLEENDFKAGIVCKVFDKNGKIVFKKNKEVKVKGKQNKSLNYIWAPKQFESDFYRVQAEAKKGGIVFDKIENGFLFIEQQPDNMLLSIKGKKFYLNSKPAMLFGANYYESKIGELLWINPNILKINNDFQMMQNLGINFIRIHYHHSKWFRDYFSDVLKIELFPYLQDADETYLPSERSLRILDALIYLAGKHKMIFCADLFTLVPKEMGNPVGWLGLKERIIDKDKKKYQQEFIKVIADRYKNIPGIVWDLWNEPRLDDSDLKPLREWVLLCKNTFRENGDRHLMTIGGPISLKLIDVLDYASLHTYNPEGSDELKNLDKPFIFGEIWNDAGCSLIEEKRQADKMSSDISKFLKSGACGFVPWQWTRQARLWNDLSEPERWDDELGCCVNADGHIKLAGEIYSEQISCLKTSGKKRK